MLLCGRWYCRGQRRNFLIMYVLRKEEGGGGVEERGNYTIRAGRWEQAIPVKNDFSGNGNFGTWEQALLVNGGAVAKTGILAHNILYAVILTMTVSDVDKMRTLGCVHISSALFRRMKLLINAEKFGHKQDSDGVFKWECIRKSRGCIEADRNGMKTNGLCEEEIKWVLSVDQQYPRNFCDSLLKPLLEIKCLSEKTGGSGYGLFARCRFEKGDIVTFMSKSNFEKTNMKGNLHEKCHVEGEPFFVGGEWARDAVSVPVDSIRNNACITEYGAVRAIQRILSGHEILVDYNLQHFYPAKLLDMVVYKDEEGACFVNPADIGIVTGYGGKQDGSVRYVVKYNDGTIAELNENDVRIYQLFSKEDLERSKHILIWNNRKRKR